MPLKVLHVLPSFYPAWSYGGPIESSYQLCRHLALAGCDLRVLTTDADGVERVLEVEKTRPVELSSNMTVRYCRRVFRHSVSPTLLRELPNQIRWADIVHLTATYNFPVIPTLLACRLLRKPLVWSPRGALQRWGMSRRRLAKSVWELVCRIATHPQTFVHVTSEMEELETVQRLPGLKVIVIGNGVTIPAEAASHCVDGTLRLGYLGRLDPKKGIENLLRACRILSDRGFAYSLKIAGAGAQSYVASLASSIDRLSLSRSVHMMGRLSPEDRGLLFENIDLAVTPSHIENFGNVIAEALAHGVPVIASKGTPWSRVNEIGCGLWTDNDPESLAEAICRMSRMPLHEMGERGRHWMLAEFSWEQRARDFIQYYRLLAGQSEGTEMVSRDYQKAAGGPGLS